MPARCSLRETSARKESHSPARVREKIQEPQQASQEAEEWSRLFSRYTGATNHHVTEHQST
jgi:hypothetical protein